MPTHDDFLLSKSYIIGKNRWKSLYIISKYWVGECIIDVYGLNHWFINFNIYLTTKSCCGSLGGYYLGMTGNWIFCKIRFLVSYFGIGLL